MNHYYIYGKAGDIIFAMPAIKAHGNGGIIITGIPFGQYKALKPLIDYQDGFTLEHESEYGFPKDTINLEACRYQETVKQHLIYAFAKTLNVEVDINKRWLRVPFIHPALPQAMKNIMTVNITNRYRDKLFNWKRVLVKYGQSNTLYFIGSVEDYRPYRMFCKYFAGDFLICAQLVKQSKMFLGTCSAWLAIAQGLGVSYGFERSPFYDSSVTKRMSETILNSNFTRKLHYALSQLQSIKRKLV